MRVPRRQVCLAGMVLLVIAASVPAASQSESAAAERVLGPNWQQLSRRAGIIFAGTVLNGGGPQGIPVGGVSALELSFYVDRAIAGVSSGQVLTIHEWVGVGSQLPSLRRGERVLLFLYPPSRLGLTSPVGGALGVIRLDAAGNYALNAVEPLSVPGPSATVTQLERAILGARSGSNARFSRRE